ncbi:hypothetical protein [Nocardiopsis sp. LOL_012]|uniref:hypothetical protein n=1 Tax=Nocardiopsis sp. LOL_012 TaxID=3345409 RepID=UPI003A8A56E9
MFERIGSLGDRLLSRVVPGARASASPYCWYEYLPISSPCYRRYCCDPPGSTYGVSCGTYKPC